MDRGEPEITRRRLLGGSLAGAAALALPTGFLAACGGDDDEEPAAGGNGATTQELGDTVVYGYFGGDFGAAQERIMFEPFRQETGVRVATVATDFARFRLMAERGNPTWDSTDADNFIAAEWIDMGILQQLGPEVPRLDLIDEEFQDWFGGCYFFSYAQGYRNETFADGGPENWADFWDVERFPGRRGLPREGFFPGVMEAALMADGVSKDELYPLDLDRAINKLDEIRDNTQFYESYGAGAQLLAQGSVALLFDPVSRIHSVGEAGTPTTIVWNQAILTYSASVIPKDPPHEAEINALMAWMADPRRQAQLAEATLNAPSVEEAFEHIPEDVQRNLANSEEHREQAAIMDVQQLKEQYTEIEERYAQWLAG